MPGYIEALFAVSSHGYFCPVLPALLPMAVVILPNPTGISEVIMAGPAYIETNPNVRLPEISSEYLKSGNCSTLLMGM